MMIKYTNTAFKSAKGFTLVELSIVIVIIGLIVAGVTVGKSLVQATKLRSLITDSNSIKTAVSTFKGQYGYLPGDIVNASNYWPNCDATPTNCNGNGDKLITKGTDTQSESTRAWQHLSLAALLRSQYTGVTNAASPGVNCPKTSISDNSCLSLGIAWLYTRNNSVNFIMAGSLRQTNNTWADESLLTSADALSIDAKIDDGIASSGSVVVQRGISLNAVDGRCVSGAYNASSVTWVLTDTLASCRIFFLL
jgi:prepilin-type N-terminal cleavage/methylation domain-containing protein